MFPFSIISMGLFSITIGAFFLVALPILVVVYLILLVVGYRASIKLGRRLLFGEGHGSEGQTRTKSAVQRKHLKSQGTDMDLWDRWIDGRG